MCIYIHASTRLTSWFFGFAQWPSEVEFAHVYKLTSRFLLRLRPATNKTN